MADRTAVRDELLSAFEDAEYPVTGPMQLVPALPDGPTTTFETGDFSMSAVELNRELDGDFPYDDPETFVDDVVDQLDAEGHL